MKPIRYAPRPWLVISTDFNSATITIDMIGNDMSEVLHSASLINDHNGSMLAHLFAASPQLLEACKIAVDIITDLQTARQDPDFKAEDLLQIREAIEFATRWTRLKPFKAG